MPALSKQAGFSSVSMSKLLILPEDPRQPKANAVNANHQSGKCLHGYIRHHFPAA
jgi:hypothetical protein